MVGVVVGVGVGVGMGVDSSNIKVRVRVRVLLVLVRMRMRVPMVVVIVIVAEHRRGCCWRLLLQDAGIGNWNCAPSSPFLFFSFRFFFFCSPLGAAAVVV